MATYALLVGIDAYQGGVAPLRGCVADAEAMRNLILERQSDAVTRLLLDDDATRERFVTVFHQHFAPAADGDTAIIWYSGHGSQSPTAAGADLEPDGLDETLVFVDSRLPGRRDLLDKEFGTLISSLAKRGVRVVVGLDACHSGSGTREELPDGTLIRRTTADTRVIVDDERGSRVTGAPPGSTGWDLSGPHVLLAACRSDQTAKERPIGGGHRGVFTAAVERALRTGGAHTYRELLPLIRDAVVAAGVSDQVPQFEAIGSTDTDSAFLGAGAAGFVLAYDSMQRCWTLDAGAIHGVPSAIDGSTRIEGHHDERDMAPLAVLTPTQIDPHRTLLRIVEGNLQPERTYPARIVGWSLPRLGVAVRDEDAALRLALTASVLLHTDPLGPLRVSAGEGFYSIVDGLVGAQEVLRIPAGPLAVPGVVDALEKIARWHCLEALTNPSAGAVAKSVSLRVRGSAAIPTGPGELTLPYVPGEGGESVPQRVDFVLHNTGDRRLYCGLFNLGPSYSVKPMLAAGVVALDPGEETVRSGKAFIPDAEAAAGVTLKSETLKLIVSTEQFESFPIVQQRLDAGMSRDGEAVARQLATPAANTLAALLRTARTRDFTFDDTPAVDWSTETLRTVIERPLPRAPISGSTSLAPGVTLAAPTGMGGTARLVSSTTIARDLAGPLTPPLLLDSPQSWTPFSLQPVRDAAAPLDVLELSDDVDVTAVTPTTPLTIEFDQGFDSEHVLVIAFDGTDYLPVGFADRRASSPGEQRTRIRITSIPAPITDKSLVGSVRLLFRRFWGKLTGRGGEVARLATPEIHQHAEHRSVTYHDRTERLRDSVARAQRVLLIVHGIIGDTEGIVLGCADAGILRRYDLVLTFDYENINTPIEDSARLLRDRLAGVGATPSGPAIDILAHSMGGLVSRWMLEILADPPKVARLVTAGTPNDGSPWATIGNWATVILGLGLNQLATVFWPAKLIGWLIAAIEKIDHAFDQLAPESPFLKRLASADDPGIHYFVVLGDRSVAAPSTGRRDQLLGKILHGAVDVATAFAFMRESNDLAVSKTSGLALPTPRVPPAALQTGVACDHLTYFSTPEGQAALVAALARDGGRSTS